MLYWYTAPSLKPRMPSPAKFSTTLWSAVKFLAPVPDRMPYQTLRITLLLSLFAVPSSLNPLEARFTQSVAVQLAMLDVEKISRLSNVRPSRDPHGIGGTFTLVIV